MQCRKYVITQKHCSCSLPKNMASELRLFCRPDAASHYDRYSLRLLIPLIGKRHCAFSLSPFTLHTISKRVRSLWQSLSRTKRNIRLLLSLRSYSALMLDCFPALHLNISNVPVNETIVTMSQNATTCPSGNVAMCCVLSILSIAAVSLRFWARSRQNLQLKPDDWLMLPGSVRLSLTSLQL